MKYLFLLLLAGAMMSCNDSATGTDHSVDNTDNDDTSLRVVDSLDTIDSLKGR